MAPRDFSLKRLFVRCAAGALVAALTGTVAAAWESAHGDRDNSGFADVATLPAGKGSVSVPGLGSFRPGAGPVVAPDGTVYLGTVQGKVIALHADGNPFWSRDITPGEAIVASPAVGSDGSVYVIGVQASDSRQGTHTSTLHRFTGSGGWVAQIPFPDHPGKMGPLAIAPPNIGRFGGADAIIVPTLYPNRFGGHAVRLIAFAPDGRVLDDQAVFGIAGQVGGGSGWETWELAFCFVPPLLGCYLRPLDFNPRYGPGPLVDAPPFPGVAIAPGGGGSSLVVMSDYHSDVIGYVVSNGRFTESFRLHQNGFFVNTPPILPGSRVVAGSQKAEDDDYGVPRRTGPARLALMVLNRDRTSFIDGVGLSYAAPTRLPDGRIALVGTTGEVTIVSGTQVAAKLQAPGRSIASAAASRTHLFVAAEDGFVTYDAATLAEVSRVDWVGGGLNPPAIGPKGHVYAIASNILFVFPPPIKKPFTVVNQAPGGQPAATNPGSGAKPQAQSYKPPTTANGNRLFACEELDGDDCGKGDHSEISLAWCQKQGYPKATDYDVDSKKVKAETLDGRFCSKNKCKVFEQIVCAN
jgi:hypothetical protein